MSRSRKRTGKPRPSTRPGQGGRRQTTADTSPPTKSGIAKIGKTLAWIGGILFVIGNIGARTGWVTLPFDPHHFYAQFGGAVLLLIGVTVAGRR